MEGKGVSQMVIWGEGITTRRTAHANVLR